MKPLNLRLVILVLILLITNISFSQTTDLVKSDGILNDMHQKHIGEITFMSKVIPIDDYSEKDFLKVYELKEKGDFNIRVFMGNSLTNYLHPLAPELAAEEINKVGNYQFSFYVDSQFIYKENLVVGAGSSENKKVKTIFRIPFLSSSNEDSWGRFMWNRFMNNGGDDAFTNGKHILHIEIRPYIKLGEVKCADIIAQGSIDITVNRPKIDSGKVKIQIIKKQNSFPISNANFNKNKIVELNTKILEKQFKEITSLVVIKNNELILEEYFNGASRKTMHDTRSVGKSFASALMGIAIDKGYIKSDAKKIESFYKLQAYKNYAPMKDSISIKNLLSMSSGFLGSDENADSPGNEENMYPTSNWVKFTLDLPLDSNKKNGEKWAYFTAGVVLLGDIINKSVPDGLEKFAEKELFQPMGIKKYQWGYTPQKVANTAGGLKMSSLDYAKFGQLYLNKGMYNGQQIISQKWVEASLFKHIVLAGREGNYGYLFWQKDYVVNGKKYEAYFCSGNGGNKIMMFKDLNLVIVITAKAYNMAYAHTQVDKIVQQYLLPAITQ